MSMGNPMYTTPVMYASPAIPQMASSVPYGNPYNGLSPYIPGMATPQTTGYYPAMSPMQIQQPYPGVYQRNSCCCCDCCYGDCSCCLGIFAAFCICCFCCNDESDECC